MSQTWANRTVAAVLLVLAPSLVDIKCASAEVGIAGGSLRIDENTAIGIPDSLVVSLVRNSGAGVYVVAGNARVSESGSLRYLSELWLFPPRDRGMEAPKFLDRKVLLSFKTRHGASQKLIQRVVTGPQAAAVQVNGWEWAQTVIFNNSGEQIDLPREAIAEACACDPSYIQPLTWLSLGKERQEDEYLVCHVGEEGGLGPFVMLYRLSDGSVSVRSPQAAFGELGDALMRFYYWDY